MNKREYTQANKEWLATKAQEEGVKPLTKGIYYKVLAEGKADEKHPTPRSIVTAHYTGRTIDGKQFDSSRGGAPLAIRLCDLIEGWIIAMQQMCVWATNGRSISLPKWVMASFRNQAYQEVPLSSSRLSFLALRK